MLRCAKHLRGLAEFEDLAATHDVDPVANLCGDVQVRVMNGTLSRSRPPDQAIITIVAVFICLIPREDMETRGYRDYLRQMKEIG